jgi:hypothetical protein
MLEEYVEKAWEMLKEFPRISPQLIARKFKLDLNYARRVCEQVWLRQHNEAKLAASMLENEGFPAQLQKGATRQNLEKFKGKKKKSA